MESSNLTALPEDGGPPESDQPSYPSPSLAAFASVPHRPASVSSLKKYSPVDWRNYFDSEDDVVIPESNDSFHVYLAGNEGPVVLCLHGGGYSGSIKATIERYKKANSDGTNIAPVIEINAQYYQQESAKLRQQIQMLQNSNRNLMGENLSSLSIKEMKQIENRLERGITRIRSKKHEMLLAEIEFLQRREVELENESVFLGTKIDEIERIQQGNIVAATGMNTIQAMASYNFFSPNMIVDGGGCSHPNKKALHLG